MLDWFKDYWNKNRKGVRRDVAHLFRNEAFTDSSIGCAFRKGLCNDEAYGVNDFSLLGSVDLRAALFAHELGQ